MKGSLPTAAHKLATAVIARLHREGVAAWMLHLDRLDEARLLVHEGGDEVTLGTSDCVSGALRWGRRVAGFSLGFASNERRRLPSAIGALVASLETTATPGSLPRVRVGCACDDSPPWSSWVGTWKEGLARAAADAPHVDMDLALERREIVLVDHRGRWRHVRRHLAHLTLIADRGAWTFCLNALAPPRIANLIERNAPVLRGASGRTHGPRSGVARMHLRPTAFAQFIARDRATGRVGTRPPLA